MLEWADFSYVWKRQTSRSRQLSGLIFPADKLKYICGIKYKAFVCLYRDRPAAQIAFWRGYSLCFVLPGGGGIVHISAVCWHLIHHHILFFGSEIKPANFSVRYKTITLRLTRHVNSREEAVGRINSFKIKWSFYGSSVCCGFLLSSPPKGYHLIMFRWKPSPLGFGLKGKWIPSTECFPRWFPGSIPRNLEVIRHHMPRSRNVKCLRVCIRTAEEGLSLSYVSGRMGRKGLYH